MFNNNDGDEKRDFLLFLLTVYVGKIVVCQCLPGEIICATWYMKT